MKNMAKMFQDIEKDINKKEKAEIRHETINKEAAVTQTSSILTSNYNNTLGIDVRSKVESKNITVSLKQSIHDTISIIAKENNGKTSSIIKNILLKLYNKDNKSFEYPIEPKVVDKQKGMSVNLPVELINVIDNISKETNKSKSEIIEELVAKYLEETLRA